MDDTINSLSLQIYAFETKTYNIEQHAEQYIKPIDKQTIQNLTNEIEKESSNNNIYTVISDLEDKKAELVLDYNRITDELANLRPYMVKYVSIKENIPSYRERII